MSARTVNYIVKYVTKTDQKHKNYIPKILASNQPGIGSGYLKTLAFKKNKFNGKETNETYRLANGAKIALPIYYRNKIYTEEEREKLWIQKLDSGIRWIAGDKVQADDEEGIERLLEYHQRINAERGYGSPATWKTKEYEEQRRAMVQERRMQILREKEKREKRKINKEVQEKRHKIGVLEIKNRNWDEVITM